MPRRRLAGLGYYLASLPTLLRGVRSRGAALRLVLGRHRGPVAVVLRDGTRLLLRSALELWVVKETCLDRQYEPAGLAVGPGATVLDIGASIGDFSISVARRIPDGRVVAFEPAPETARLLTANVRLNRVANVTVHPIAITDRDGEVELALDLARPVLNTTRIAVGDPRPRLLVACRRLDGLLDELGIVTCDLLKIDCEGAEVAILEGAGTAGLRRVRGIALEYHDPPARRRIVALLGTAGFRVWCRRCPVHPGQGLLYAARPAAP